MTEPDYLQQTRAAYDTVAEDYAALLEDDLQDQPWDRAMLGAFAELALRGEPGMVADVGCGPGRITAHLHSLGLPVRGIDLSPAMIAVARRRHPGLRFDVGELLGLDLEDGVLAGAVAWYSIIHTPPELLPQVFVELHRVLRPGGPLLLAFQVGDELRHVAQGYGHEVSLDAYRLPPERLTAQLQTAGFVVEAELVRAPGANEKSRQAYLLASKS